VPYDLKLSNLPSGARYVRVEASGIITGADVEYLYHHELARSGLALMVLTHKAESYQPEARALISKYSAHEETQPWTAVVIDDPRIRVTSNFIRRVGHTTRSVQFASEDEAVQWLEELVLKDPAVRAKAGAP
jgi:hypothetical protein